MPKKTNIRNEGIALAHSLRHHHGGEGMLTGAGDGWSHGTQDRKQREEVELVLAILLSSSVLLIQRPQAMGWATYTQGGFLLPSSSSLETPSQTSSKMSSRQSQTQPSWP